MLKVPKRFLSSILFSMCCCNIYSLVSLNFVFTHFLLHVSSNVNFFNSMLGCRSDLFKVRAKSMDYIHSSYFLILEKKYLLISCRFDSDIGYEHSFMGLMGDPHKPISRIQNEDLGCSSICLAISELDSEILIDSKWAKWKTLCNMENNNINLNI